MPQAVQVEVSRLHGRIDFVLVTIRSDELDALLKRFPPVATARGPRGHVYSVSVLQTLSLQQYAVAITCCTEEGTGEAQSVTRNAIEDLDPRCIIVVGIGGGAPSMDFTLGDVIISTRVVDLTVKAQRPDGTVELSSGGGPVMAPFRSFIGGLGLMREELGDWYSETVLGVPVPRQGLQLGKLIGQKSEKKRLLEILHRHFDREGRRCEPVRHKAAAVGSGDDLHKNPTLLKRLRTDHRKLEAVEMEVAGAFRAAHEFSRPCFTIRGISDIIGLQRDDGWTKFACETAAAFTAAFLRLQPVDPVGFATAFQLGLPSPTNPSKLGGNSDPETPARVFTPRNPTVNVQMYVERPELELALSRALGGHMHLVIHGESGSGKTWLYKRVFQKLNVKFSVANLSHVARERRIDDVIYREVCSTVQMRQEELVQDRLERSFELLRNFAGDAPCCIVLDNLEVIFQSAHLMQELGNVLILLDDERYARHYVKLLIVGVPAGVRSYFAKAPTSASIANRLSELPEVARMSKEQVSQFVLRGFREKLCYSPGSTSWEDVAAHVDWVTMGVPQRLHEYCLALAQLAEPSRRIEAENLLRADQVWLKSHLSAAYSRVLGFMNDRDTKLGRRNQVLYALGRVERSEFRYNEVEEIVRREFSKSAGGKTLNVSGMLSELAEKPDSIIKRSPKNELYQFVDPVYKMCIRAMLFRDGERVFNREPQEMLELPVG